MEEGYDPGVDAWLEMVQVYQRIHRRVSVVLHEYDLTLAQFDVLVALYFTEELTQQELAERLLVTKGNICGLLDRLERRNLVQRVPDPDDKRVNRTSLTEGSREMVRRALPEHAKLVAGLMKALNRDEQHFLYVLLHRLNTSLSSA